MTARHAAFTLLEICLTLLIGMVLVLLAVPSVAGLFAEQRLHESYTRFEHLVNTARARSVTGQRPCQLVWDRQRILLKQEGAAAGGDGETLTLAEGENLHLNRVAALLQPAPEAWTFWPDGTCEPVVVSYQGRDGRWQVRFDALTARATFQQSETL